ncbi:hypothetical protein PR048_029043 [Dryococelus australis]|uniref:Uncharacterized protein n=1 Tax=Dryococelus australis TaxID=614101 RepID=A0ABQ9GCU7_9NEOP|nr:hypothetical protein PR048_029043 [Dryococelus australis]
MQIPEKTRRPAASSGTIPTCENPERPRRESNPVRVGGRRVVWPLHHRGPLWAWKKHSIPINSYPRIREGITQQQRLSKGMKTMKRFGRLFINEILRTVEDEARRVRSSSGMQVPEKREIPEVTRRPEASSRHDSLMRKPDGNPAGNRTRFALVSLPQTPQAGKSYSSNLLNGGAPGDRCCSSAECAPEPAHDHVSEYFHLHIKAPVYLELLPAFEAEKRENDKVDSAMHIKCAIAIKQKALNSAMLTCVYLYDFQR